LKVSNNQTSSLPRSNNNSQSPNSRARSVSTKSASKLLTRTYVNPPSANVTPVNNGMPIPDRHLKERPRNKYHSIGNNLGVSRDIILNHKIPGGSPKHRKLFSSASTAYINNSSMNHNTTNQSQMLHFANNTKSLENSQMDVSVSTNRKENIELIVNELTKTQESNIDNFNGYKAAFEALIDYTQFENASSNLSIDLLIKVKTCYDKLIEQLLGRESLAQNIYDENKEFALEFQRFGKENQRLEREMNKIGEENIKLKDLLQKLNSKLPNHNHNNNNANSDKADLGSYDSPLISAQNTEIINLKQIIHKQEESINHLKYKESRMVRLLLAIKKQGFDIESIYNEEVRDKPDTTSDMGLKLNFPDFSLHRDSTTAPSDNSNKDAMDSVGDSIDKRLRKTFSGLKSASESMPSSPVMKHANLDKNLKDKLKLDLNFLKKNQQQEHVPPQIPKFEINEKVLNKQGVGFHDEFMSKIGEFSLSWRQAALNERKV
jgi:hypothetical protein